MLLFFKSSTPYIDKDLRDTASALRVVEKFQIKDVRSLPDRDNVVG